MAVPVQVPTLDDLAQQPELAVGLDWAAALALHARALRALAALEAPLLAHAHVQPLRAAETDGGALLDARGVAKLIGVSKSWVDHHTADLPSAVRIGSRPRWRRSDLERWLRTRPAYGREP